MHQPISKEEMRSRIARNLRELRLARGLSQEQLAAKAEVHRTFVGQVENEAKVPSIDSLVMLANALGVDPSTITSRKLPASRKRGLTSVLEPPKETTQDEG